MFTLALSLAIASAGPSVLVLDLKPIEVPPGEAELLTNLVTDAVTQNGAGKVTSAGDLRRVIELEAQKAAVGCDTDSCLMELAGASGVDYVVFGDVGKLGAAYVMNLRLFRSKTAETVSRTTLTTSGVDEARTKLPDAIAQLMEPAVGVRARGSTSSAGSTTSTEGLSPLVIGGGITAGVAAAGAAVLGLWALSLDATLGDTGADGAAKTEAYGMQPAVSGLALGAALVAVAGGGIAVAGFMTEGT